MLGEPKIKFLFLFCPLTTLKAKTLTLPSSPSPFLFSFFFLHELICDSFEYSRPIKQLLWRLVVSTWPLGVRNAFNLKD